MEMDSDNYKIDSGGFVMTAGKKQSENYKIQDVVGENFAGQFQSSGYIVRTGLSYLGGDSQFTFSLSSTQLDLGSLSPNTAALGHTDIVISNGLSRGYTLYSSSIGPLTSSSGATIPKTVCDIPSDPCTILRAKVWTNNAAYGLGYNMSGSFIPSDFTDSTFFRPFSDLTKNESMVTIMDSQTHKTQDQARITYKTIISPLQAVGRYKTTISFLAIPGY